MTPETAHGPDRPPLYHRRGGVSKGATVVNDLKDAIVSAVFPEKTRSHHRSADM